VELTSTNWSCGLFVLAKANIETHAQNRARAPLQVNMRVFNACARYQPVRLDTLNKWSKPSLPSDAKKFSGGFIEEAPPDPIPNSEVKLLRADGTARGILVGE
jgi:hypothetical protein